MLNSPRGPGQAIALALLATSLATFAAGYISDEKCEGPPCTGSLGPGRSVTFDKIGAPAAIEPAFVIAVSVEGEGRVAASCNVGGYPIPPDTFDFSAEVTSGAPASFRILPLDYAAHPDVVDGMDPGVLCIVAAPREQTGGGEGAVAVAYSLSVRVYSYVYQDLYDSCCRGEEGACAALVPPEEGGLVDMCALEGWACNAAGQVVTLNATGYGLACPFPTDTLAKLPALEVIDMTYNNVTGSFDDIAARLAQSLPGLRVLALSGNAGIGGELAQGTGEDDGVCALVKGNLTVLELSDAGVSGPLPGCLFGEDSALRELQVARSGLEGELPETFSNATRLEVLLLSQNEIGGTLPEGLAYVKGLRELDLSHNALAGDLPDFSADAPPQLAALLLAGNDLTGTIPAGLATHPTLRLLDLSSNALTALPEAWGAAAEAPGGAAPAPALQALDLSNNNLQDAFPQALALSPKLLVLLLSANNLTGTLPELPEGGGFRALRLLDISSNGLTGTVPDSWESMGIFTQAPAPPYAANLFNASHNDLTGDLPSWLSSQSLDELAARGVPVRVSLSGNAFSNGCEAAFEGVPGACMEEPSDDDSNGGDQDAVPDGSTGSSGSSLAGGAVAGVVIGVMVAFVAALGAVFYARRRRHLEAQGGLTATPFQRFEGEDDFSRPPRAVELTHVEEGAAGTVAHGAVGPGR